MSKNDKSTEIILGRDGEIYIVIYTCFWITLVGYQNGIIHISLQSIWHDSC